MTPRPPHGSPVRAVLFDYGLTLTTFTRPVDAVRDAYRRIAAMVPGSWDADQLLDAVHDRVDARVRAHEAAGELREIDIYASQREAYAELGVALDEATLDRAMQIEQEAWWQGVHLAPDVPATLDALRRAGMRIGICSNAAYRPSSMRDQLAHVGLLPLIDSATFSGEVGWRKPSPQIFAAALAALDAEPATTVMVGDRAREDVAGAHGVGMRAVRLREHDDDPGTDGSAAEAVLDRLADLPFLLGSAQI